ncbi:MAG: tRNA (adenosine(37)-N6)-threonylcarbamoyltransferase complex dimerization subunit type 1 TsaB [Vicinamibacterales bacterium]
MVILALDTTTRGGSCALTRGDVLVLEQQGEPERPQAARLPDDLMRLLTHAGAALADVDVFAVATGPGSFTGLRIGIAAMQGLAFAGGKPLVGISALDALASTTHHPPSTAHQPAPATHAWIDAWRGEVYAATYLDGHEVEPPVVARPADLLREVGERRRLRTESVFIGNGAVTYRELILSTLGRLATIAEPAAPPLAAAIAGLAFEEAQAGRLAPPHAIMPVYVRRTYAELAREREKR